ncbi:hypothetical protein GGX14DRAFT_535913 [Mycena pura]|uniref:Reverse transcriptase zinc-binding domain-containing protein n=1 Tax=Mycena pura TaxID=153505 RepID=A0AAD6YB14_9AGAR|nr:hypothetical protein GGX14DRAFT_535913 [Mycena pura]
MAVRKVSVETTLTIVSAQPYVQEAMNKKLGRWENEGWVGVKHRDILRCLRSLGPPHERPVGKPPRYLAKRAARAQVTGVWDMTLPTGMTLPGLRLQGNRQKIFYRSIREEKTEKLRARPSTANKLKVIRDAVYDTFGREVTDAQIWNSLLAKDFLPRPSQFFWKCVHNAHKVGSYWTHIPDCGDRATCRDCGEPEDLEHILVRCESPGREMIWAAAKTLWLERQKTWPEILYHFIQFSLAVTLSLGTILGCGLAEFRDSRGKIDRGAQRLYRVLISESAYLIWRLRNERVIDRDGEPASEEEIVNKFKFTINQRLQMDRLLANRPRRGKLPKLPPKLVLATWSGIMDNEHSLPTDWLGEPRVLVGNRAFPPRTPFRQDENQGIG